MAATKNNQFWKKRAKHGRDKIFKDPNVLLECCYDYFNDCETNPLEVEHVTSKGEIVKIKKPRPFKLRELCNYLGITDLENYAKDESYKDFWHIITHVKSVIFSQKFDYAAIGEYNANIIARDLGLSDKSNVDVTTDGEKLNQISKEDRDKMIAEIAKILK